jgi:hypothetical protein
MLKSWSRHHSQLAIGVFSPRWSREAFKWGCSVQKHWNCLRPTAGMSEASAISMSSLSIVDESWGLVGSGNLTNAGLCGTDQGHMEFGVVLSPAQIDSAFSIYEGWWCEAD